MKSEFLETICVRAPNLNENELYSQESDYLHILLKFSKSTFPDIYEFFFSMFGFSKQKFLLTLYYIL